MTNQVRVIGGRHRGRRLHFVPGRGLRPTPDRVRETLFNWLRADVAGARCIDLFAGSGALGFEALSRGAEYVTFVEHNRAAALRLRDNIGLLGEQARADVIIADVRKLLATPPARAYDIAFLDPPFADGLLPMACAQLDAQAWLAPTAVVYLEQDAAQPWPEPPPDWSLYREGKAGQSAQRLLRCSKLG